VKASGGIRTAGCTLDMLDAGASRIGTSNALAIIAELETYALAR
jgi:deoxyribose-phosphate aldolase